MFHLGQKVVCIDDKIPEPVASWDTLNGLTKGNIYTIRWIGMYKSTRHELHLCIRVEEIFRKPLDYYGIETPFNANRFKPLIEKKTDISIFTSMLPPVPVKKKELENV